MVAAKAILKLQDETVVKMRLIDADEAVKIIKKYDDRGLTLDEVARVTDGIAKEIEAMPTVDAEPVRHGKWIKDGVMERCSECNMPTMQPHISGQPQFKICPYCSAKMDGE